MAGAEQAIATFDHLSAVVAADLADLGPLEHEAAPAPRFLSEAREAPASSLGGTSYTSFDPRTPEDTWGPRPEPSDVVKLVDGVRVGTKFPEWPRGGKDAVKVVGITTEAGR